MPFWAITKHADVTESERDNTLFPNARCLGSSAESDEVHLGAGVSSLVHGRRATPQSASDCLPDWFKPKAMRAMKARIDELAKSQRSTRWPQRAVACDFVQEIAINYPPHVILSLLGLPESDFPFVLKLTRTLWKQRRRIQTRCHRRGEILASAHGYVRILQDTDRGSPGGADKDLASTIANARIDGELLGDM